MIDHINCLNYLFIYLGNIDDFFRFLMNLNESLPL